MQVPDDSKVAMAMRTKMLSVTKAKAAASKPSRATGAKRQAKAAKVARTLHEAPWTTDSTAGNAPMLMEDIVSTVLYYKSFMKEEEAVKSAATEKVLMMCIEFGLKGQVQVVDRPDLKQIKDMNVTLALLLDPAQIETKAPSPACVRCWFCYLKIASCPNCLFCYYSIFI